MAKLYDTIEPQLVEFIQRQQMLVVATAAAHGRVNVSPKGLDTFCVIDAKRVAWLNGTGSGHETAARTGLAPGVTLASGAFEWRPWIRRLYGRARAVQPGDRGWEELAGLFPPLLGARQVFDVTVEQC